jgi:hypothetical protein
MPFISCTDTALTDGLPSPENWLWSGGDPAMTEGAVSFQTI